MKLQVGKTCLITKVGAAPPRTIIITGKGAAPLTHSLFGRYSASLSFPLVSPEKRGRIAICIVKQQEVQEDVSNVKPPPTWGLEVRTNKDTESVPKPLSSTRLARVPKENKPVTPYL